MWLPISPNLSLVVETVSAMSSDSEAWMVEEEDLAVVHRRRTGSVSEREGRELSGRKRRRTGAKNYL